MTGTESRQGAADPLLRELLLRHLPQIEHFVRRHLSPGLRERESASDLVHSVCGDLLGEDLEFEYRGEAQFQKWLQAVVLNKIRGRLRGLGARKRGGDRVVAVTDSQLVAAHVGVDSPSQQAMLREDLSLLDRALAELPEHYRDIIVRSRIRGESRERIAAELGRTVPSVRNLLTRALVKLAGSMDRLQSSGGAPGCG